MYEAEPKDLFETRLNSTGKLYIRKFATLVRYIILLSIIISSLNIIAATVEAIKIDIGIYAGNKLLLLRHKISPFYTAVYFILFAFQIYYYWMVTRYLSRGIKYNDETEFNQSFQALYHHAFFGALTLGLALLMNIFDFYLFTKFYLN